MKKSTMMILLVVNAMGYTAIYTGAFLHYYYYNLMEIGFHLTNTQIGIMGSIIGLGQLAAYIIGGFIADKISIKKLMIIGYISQAALMLWYATIPSWPIIITIQCLFIITALVIYWGAYIKFVRSLGDKSQEARIFGLWWGIVGITGTLLGVVGAGIITKFPVPETALRYVLLWYAAILVIAAIVDIFLYHPKEVKASEEDKFKLSQISFIVKNKEFWALTLMNFSGYFLCASAVYFSPMLNSNYGVSVAIVSALSVFRAWGARIIFAPVSGALISKANSTAVVMRVLIIMGAIIALFIALVPREPAYLVIAIIAFIVLVAVYQMSVTGWVTPISECNIPDHMKGTAWGIMSAVLFSSDAFVYLLCGSWLDKYGPEKGYTMIYLLFAAVFAAGIVMSTIAIRLARKRKAIEQSMQTEIGI